MSGFYYTCINFFSDIPALILSAANPRYDQLYVSIYPLILFKSL